MNFINKNIEWIVAIAVIQLSIMLLDNLSKWVLPTVGPIFTLTYYLVIFLMLIYQINHYGLKLKSPIFVTFFLVYTIYVFLYLTVLRVYPLSELLGMQEKMSGFYIMTSLIFGYMFCAETICNKFSFRKFFYLAIFLTFLPTIYYVSIVGVDFFQYAEWGEKDRVFQVTSLAYNNAPLFVMVLLFYGDLSDNKNQSYLIAIVLAISVGYILLVSSRRGPLLWCLVNLAICYYYKSQKTFKYIVFASIFGLLIYFNIDTIIDWISIIAPSTGERIYSSIHEGASSGRYDAGDAERGTYILGINQFLESPIYGSYFRIVTSDSSFRGVYPHNIFIEVLMTMGVLGFAVFCLFLKKAFKDNHYLKKDKNKLALFSLFLASFLQLQTADSIALNVWFWVLFYVVLVMNNNNSSNRLREVTR